MEQPRRKEDSIGNSYLYIDLAASFIAQWDDEALARRDKAPQKRSHHSAAAVTTTWDLSSPSNAFLEPDTVDGGDFEWHLGLVMNTGRTRAGKRFGRG